jgi:hypothetical protein
MINFSPVNQDEVCKLQGRREATTGPGTLVNTGPPVPLDSHADGHTKIYFLIAINAGIANELHARNQRRISVPMARVACMHVTVPQMDVINLFNTGKYLISSHN